ncbi:MAG: hypothetical protein HY202_06740 [Nitrospirae bacterium]|nr:hypothetical protein [Nitrospirota bacterium]
MNKKNLFFVLLIGFIFLFSGILVQKKAGAESKITFQKIAAPLESRGKFNHDSTTFQLLGTHRGLECNKCHFAGRYKGTPRTCENCHNGQISYGKPVGHMMTGSNCTGCHNVTAWLPTHFAHDSSVTGECSTCHNGKKATGKSGNHLTTSSECDGCHKPAGWVPAGFNHADISGQLCVSCHKPGGSGKTKSDSLHNLPGLSDCGTCHASTTRFSVWKMSHTGISPPASCATCHIAGNTMGAVATPGSHPYAASNSDCSQCHKSFSSFSGAAFNHTGVTTCNTCHFKNNPSGAMGPKSDTLHNLSTLPDCRTCHSSTTTFTAFTMNHTGISPPASCATCHIAGNTMGAAATPGSHPYAAPNSDCSQCHKSFSSFSGAAFNHTGVTACKTCHYSGNATGAMAPPATAGDLIHNPISNIITDCNSCHTSTLSGGFSSSKMIHTAILNYTTTCQNCHKAGNPMGAQFKSNHHLNEICGNCHSTSTFDK